MSDNKIHFEPSTFETIDKSVLNFLLELNLFADTNEQAAALAHVR